MTQMLIVALSVAGSVGVAVGALAPPSDFPAQDPHNAALTQDPHKHMTARGEKAMGFDQAATSHHFFLFDDGGAIEVTVKQRSDKKNLAAIRTHLPEIVRLFAKGDFATHGVVHAQEVPGTEEMTRLKDRIAYAYEDIRDGGRVRIRTRHATALAAVYDFLRFQIQDHKTGDSLEITKSRELEQGDQEIRRIY